MHIDNRIARQYEHGVDICCIVPEYIHKQIAEHGTLRQRENAQQALIISEQLRGMRYEARNLFPLIPRSETLERYIFSTDNTKLLPGLKVRDEAEPTPGIVGDQAVNEAFIYSGNTYNFFLKSFNRKSIDGSGMRLDSTVHYSVSYNNAFWNGTQMVYGDGDGELFNRFTISLDVVGHELVHGITQFEADLEYQGQSGALNESFSDVLGSMVKQHSLKQDADEADWLIGDGLFKEKVKGLALRSMKDPGSAYDDPIIGKDPQPAHMKDYVETSSDNGGVHINSGIPNRAFYLTAIEIGGRAWEKAGMIWYITLEERLRKNSTFQDAAKMTFLVGGDLFGQGSREQNAVMKGWEQVGITFS